MNKKDKCAWKKHRKTKIRKKNLLIESRAKKSVKKEKVEIAIEPKEVKIEAPKTVAKKATTTEKKTVAKTTVKKTTATKKKATDTDS